MDVTRGSADEGWERMELVIWMVGFRFGGWVREIVRLSFEASRV